MITSYASLIAEKQRLKEVTKLQEASFKAEMETLKERFWPVKTFFQNTADVLNSGKGETSLLRHTLQIGVPLILDRFLLGTKGLVFRQVLTWLSRSALQRLSGKIPAGLENRVSSVLDVLGKNTLVAGLVKVLMNPRKA